MSKTALAESAGRYELDEERAELERLIRAVGTKDPGASWPRHPVFGRLRGPEWLRLEARHLDYHLTQFGV